jgi:UDP-N-acetylmuramyl pentapeptide phosphotransferase/UDP-N-acetylglucosamine-1-phosphate transferase
MTPFPVRNARVGTGSSYIISGMNAGYIPLLAPVVSAVLTVTVMLLLLRSGNLPLDRPNPRSLHSVPVPRTGGVAIMMGIFVAALTLRADHGIVGPAAALAALSYLDDQHQLPALVRLMAHLLAAGIFVWSSIGFENTLVAVILILALAWLTNLYNFMDGSDGLAGGMAVIGFSAYAIAAWLGGMIGLSLLSLSIAAAAAGFLIFNFPPARIFMGDVGSIPLGFLAGAIGAAGWRQGLWPSWFPLVVFAPFIVDASVTLVRRLLRGQRVWQAHRQHYYQRLILSGWSHRKTAASEYALMLTCAAAGVLCLRASPAGQFAVIIALTAGVVIVMWAIDRNWRHFSAGAHD